MENNTIKFARLAYSASWNLGDHIQTFATERFLGENPISIERDKLDEYDGDKALLLMQGYFFADKNQCAFPPSKNIIPAFVGFHIEDQARTREQYASREIIDYIRQHEPIGCRDNSTVDYLKGFGINAYFSRCLTLTFPRRDQNIKGSKVFFIDEPEWLKPSPYFGKKFNKLYEEAEFFCQVVDKDISILPDEKKREMAISRLNLLKNEAKLVVTSRLHIASPCLAMGIPVVLIPREMTPVRYQAIEGLTPIYSFPTKHFKSLGKGGKLARRLAQIFYVRFKINWNPKPVDIESLKASMIENTQNVIKTVLDKNK